MSVIAHLCGVKGEVREVIAPPSAARIREIVAAAGALGLVEPDLPIGKLALPRDPVDRAVLAIVTRGAPRAVLLAPGPARLARVKDERALDLVIALAPARLATPPEFAALEAGPRSGKELLRASRARRGSASTKDGAELGRAVVRAWSAGILDLQSPS